MNWWLWGSIGAVVIVLPLILTHVLQRSTWFRSLVWKMQEQEYPMPKPTWTVGYLRGRVAYNLAAAKTRYSDPRWEEFDESAYLRRLDSQLATRPSGARLTPQEIDAWLTIRDLRGT